MQKKQPYSEYSNIANHRQPQGLKPNITPNEDSSYRYRSHNNKSFDYLSSSRNQGCEFPSDFPNQFQNPQISTHKIYVHSMTPTQPNQSDDFSQMPKVESYSMQMYNDTVDPCKSFTTFTPSMTHSERDKQRVSYQSEFTVKNNSDNPATLGPYGYCDSQMARSYSNIPTNVSTPAAFQNQSSNNFSTTFYQTKSYSNFSNSPENANFSQNQYYCNDYQESLPYQVCY